jgi:hypothetical protein
VGERTVRLRSPTTEEILAWRARLTTKYRDELEEELTWDEGSTFEVSQDVGASADVMFHYVAAVFDQRGKSELSNLIDVDKLTPRVQDFLVEDRPISPVGDHLTGSLAEPKATSLTLPSSCWQVCGL